MEVSTKYSLLIIIRTFVKNSNSVFQVEIHLYKQTSDNIPAI